EDRHLVARRDDDVLAVARIVGRGLSGAQWVDRRTRLCGTQGRQRQHNQSQQHGGTQAQMHSSTPPLPLGIWSTGHVAPEPVDPRAVAQKAGGGRGVRESCPFLGTKGRLPELRASLSIPGRTQRRCQIRSLRAKRNDEELFVY